MDEKLLEILKEYIKQWNIGTSMKISLKPNGKSVIYKSIKMSGTEKLFLEQYIKMKEGKQ